MATSQAQEILSNLEKEILPTEYSRYIKNLKFNDKNSTPEFFIYNATNEFIAKYAQTKYGTKIKELIKKQFGLNDVIVKITSKAKISPKEKVKIISEKPKSTILSENYNFENFIIGDSNKFAFECSISVAKEPGIRFNPLFIYGPSGLGKTHLLQSIGNYCIKKGKTVICVTSEQFANDFVFNLKNNSIDKFKQKYRNCDVLLIDDIQFLIGRDKAQEELFYTFNELKDKNCQIVLTNDLPPKFLKGFESRLTTRFESGIIANITPPDLETKIAIINKKSEENRVRIPHDVVEYIATNMGDNIREIEGAINKLNAYSSILRTKITLEFTKSTLQDQIHQKYSSVSLEHVIEVISKELNVKPSELKSKTRAKNVVEARQICIYLTKQLTQNSMPKIAAFFNLKDHSAISKNIKKINELIQTDEILKIKIEELKNKITKKDKNEI